MSGIQDSGPGRRVKVHGHRLYYECHGPKDGTPLVLLHHGLGSTRAWKHQVPALAGAGFRVVVYDRWGYGASDPRPRLDVPHFAQDVADLAALLDTSGIVQALLVGHSDGGNVALAFAAAYPQQALAVVAVAAHIYLEDTMPQGIAQVAETYRTHPAVRAALDRAHHGRGEQVFRLWYEAWTQPALKHWDARPQFRAVTCPTLVIQGDADEHATPRHAQDLAAALPQAQVVIVSGGRHMLPQEQPETFNRLVLKFLKSWSRNTPYEEE